MEHLQTDLTLEIRAVPDGDGRTLEGRIVPYDTEIEVGETRESFAQGVFADTDPSSVVLLWQHNQTEPIGRMTDLEDRADGAYGTFRIADTVRAREALTLIRDGITRGLSVGFTSHETRNQKGGVRRHIKARLRETSLVTFPAYPSAGVLSVREEDRMSDTPATDEIAEEVPPQIETVDLSGLETRIDETNSQLREVRNQIANITTGSPVVDPPMSAMRAMGQVLKMVAANPGESRALADVIGTAPGNASGLIRNSWVSELIGYINALRPLMSAAGSAEFPDSGYGKAYPRITQHSQVAKRTGEKVAIASREILIDFTTFPMEWFAGGVDVALELIAQSDPDALEVIASDLADQYAIVTEDEFATDAVAAATASGAVLPTGTWSAFVAAMVGESAEIRAATGVPGDRLALTTASWLAVVGLLNPSQPSVSFGAGPDFTQESFGVGGISVFHAPALETDLLFNTKSLRVAERPPETVTANNVVLMGRDIGILGATIALPLYPAGIHRFAAA